MCMAIMAVPFLALASVTSAQVPLPTMRATSPAVAVRVRDGNNLTRSNWNLSPELKPDVYTAQVPDGRALEVAFLSEVDSIVVRVDAGQQYDFLIVHGADTCLTRIVGARLTPMAVFDETYRRTRSGKIFVSVPEVYELVNVAIALTPTAEANRFLVYRASPYHQEMLAWFAPVRGHPLIAAFDSVLRRNGYSDLKMNGNSFVFDTRGRIVQSPVYDRTGFPDRPVNRLRPLVPLLQAFADAGRFREFFARHRDTYAGQVAFLRDSVNVGEMRAWLARQFPESPEYSSVSIIFSPLVYGSQSVTWMESGGFRELQPHVNFPYAEDVTRIFRDAPLSDSAAKVFRGTIVFTELNHGYLNPLTDRYAERIGRATSHRDLWVDPSMGAGYYGGVSAFNEYMNWGLESLRFFDYAPPAERDRMIAMVDQTMTRGRGFPQFSAFNAFLVDLYRTRAAGQTLADLYPQIIAWFERRNAAGG